MNQNSEALTPAQPRLPRAGAYTSLEWTTVLLKRRRAHEAWCRVHSNAPGLGQETGQKQRHAAGVVTWRGFLSKGMQIRYIKKKKINKNSV